MVGDVAHGQQAALFRLAVLDEVGRELFHVELPVAVAVAGGEHLLHVLRRHDDAHLAQPFLEHLQVHAEEVARVFPERQEEVADVARRALADRVDEALLDDALALEAARHVDHARAARPVYQRRSSIIDPYGAHTLRDSEQDIQCHSS